VSNDLKAWLNAKKKPTRVLGDVERYLLTLPPEDRATDILHPSEIVKDDWCHRESYFLLRGATKKQDKPNLRLQNIFDEGHEIHDKWQKRFAEMGILWGKWDNGPGTAEWWGFASDGPKTNRRYREVTVSSSKFMMGGHGDGIIRDDKGNAWLEVKSLGEGTIRAMDPKMFYKYPDPKDAWKNVNRPFRGHRRQIWVYQELWALSGAEFYGFDINECVVIYEWKADQSIKEFVVERAPEMVADVFEGAAKVVAAVKAGKPPACNVEGCKKCKVYEEA
jgi:hypothetical protein